MQMHQVPCANAPQVPCANAISALCKCNQCPAQMQSVPCANAISALCKCTSGALCKCTSGALCKCNQCPVPMQSVPCAKAPQVFCANAPQVPCANAISVSRPQQGTSTVPRGISSQRLLPVPTSSSIKRIPCVSHSLLSPGKKPGGGVRMPPSPRIGSTIIAAVSVGSNARGNA